jgi:hypothetical protein
MTNVQAPMSNEKANGNAQEAMNSVTATIGH